MTNDAITEPRSCRMAMMMEFVDGDSVLPARSNISLAYATMMNIPVKIWTINNKKHTENAFSVGGDVTENGY